MLTFTSFISPYRADRDLVRQLHEAAGLPFIEIYVQASVELCEQRDPKGLYKKARAGEVKEFTGISAPYEEPLKPEMVIDSANVSPQQAAGLIISCLEERGLLPRQ